MALAQASRAHRGAARAAEGIADSLERSCFLLVEAWSVQETLAAMLPGMRPALAMLAAGVACVAFMAWRLARDMARGV